MHNFEKCVLCKTEDNGIEHATNNCIKLKKEREEIINKLNNLDANTKNKTLLEIIEHYYYSKGLSESKNERKSTIGTYTNYTFECQISSSNYLALSLLSLIFLLL